MAQPGYPTLGLDLDGCITDASDFFRTCSRVWPGEVLCVTFRRYRWNAEVIAGRGYSVYFDDHPEMLKPILPHVAVLLLRNEGTLDFDDQRWM